MVNASKITRRQPSPYLDSHPKDVDTVTPSRVTNIKTANKIDALKLKGMNFLRISFTAIMIKKSKLKSELPKVEKLIFSAVNEFYNVK